MSAMQGVIVCALLAFLCVQAFYAVVILRCIENLLKAAKEVDDDSI